jgi:hypothetical protein
MAPRTLEHHYREPVTLDLCASCHVIWFDREESIALAPAAVLDLFRTIGRARAATRQLPERLACPRCPRTLVLTHDVHRSGRFVYHRCPQGHGRLTTFHHFLREKGFIRELAPAEIERLRVRIGQLQCSNCGAPIDLSRTSACSYCRSALAVLDADALARNVERLEQAQTRRDAPPDLERLEQAHTRRYAPPDIERLVDLLLDQARTANRESPLNRAVRSLGTPATGSASTSLAAVASDLLSAGFAALFDRR